jgi:hypothetical protein
MSHLNTWAEYQALFQRAANALTSPRVPQSVKDQILQTLQLAETHWMVSHKYGPGDSVLKAGVECEVISFTGRYNHAGHIEHLVLTDKGMVKTFLPPK